MAKPKVIVSRRWPEAVENRMQELFDVELNLQDRPMTAAEMQDALGRCDAFCPTVSDKVDADVLGAENVTAKILGNYGVGFSHIDLDMARERNLVVTNTPGVLTDCTADIAMTLMLMAARRAGEGEREARNGGWDGWRPTHMIGTKVTGKTLGLIGFGRIAQAMAHKAHFGFGMKIVYHSRSAAPAEVEALYGASRCETTEELLQQSDFVSLHCPGGAATRHLINADSFRAMKNSAILINTARGEVVDEAAMVAALQAGEIAAAGLDVYEEEPKIHDGLLEMENVVLLPHLGSATMETRVAMGMRVVDNLVAFFDGKTPGDRVI